MKTISPEQARKNTTDSIDISLIGEFSDDLFKDHIEIIDKMILNNIIYDSDTLIILFNNKS